MRYIFITLALIFLSPIAFAEVHIKTLAQVYNVSITEHDLDDRIKILSTLSQAPLENFQPYKQKILQDMIKEEIFLHQAKKLKIKIPPEEIKEAIKNSEVSRNLTEGTIENLVLQNPDMEKSFKAQIARNQIVQGYIMPKIIVTEAEIEKQTGASKKSQLVSIASLEISAADMEAKKPLLDDLSQKVNTCPEFEKFAQDNNLAELLYIDNKIEDLNESLKSFVSSSQVGQLTDLVQTDTDKYQILMLCSKKLIETGKKSKEEIKEEIYNKKLEDAVNNYYLSLARKAHIVIYDK